MKNPKERPTKELLLLSVRINELRNLRMRTSNEIYIINAVCGNSFSTRHNSISSLSLLISELDSKIKKHEKRCTRLMTGIIKRSNKIFEESPKDLVPLGTKDLSRGYVELNEVKDDTVVLNLLLLDTGEIVPESSVKAREVLKNGPSYSSEYTMKKIAALNVLL